MSESFEVGQTLELTYCPELNIFRLRNPHTGAEKAVTFEDLSECGYGAQAEAVKGATLRLRGREND